MNRQACGIISKYGQPGLEIWHVMERERDRGVKGYVVSQITRGKGSSDILCVMDHLEEEELGDMVCHRSH